MGEQIKCYKNSMFKIKQCVKTKVSNANWLITENQLKRFWKKNMEWRKKDKKSLHPTKSDISLKKRW